MVAKKKTAKTKVTQVTDKNQSEQFRKVARELEADGDLNLTEAEEKFEEAVKGLLPSRGVLSKGGS